MLDTRLARFFDSYLRDLAVPLEDGPLPNGTDADEDLMLDAWETANGLNPASAADALADKDGDTRTNLSEYLAETDPCDPSSAFRIMASDSGLSCIARANWAAIRMPPRGLLI